MKTILILSFCFAMVSCAGFLARKQPPVSFDQVPLSQLQNDAQAWQSRVFEGRFKFYHIYHGPDRSKEGPREQRTRVPTHFTARPMSQPGHVLRIRLTPEQEAQFNTRGVLRQDVIEARVRFAGIDPDGGLAFDLVEVTRW